MKLDICSQCGDVVYQDDEDIPFVEYRETTMHATCFQLMVEEKRQAEVKETAV